MDDRDLGQTGIRQQPDMARGKPPAGGHQCRSDRRDGALLFDIVTSRDWLDDLDAGLTIGLGQINRDYGVGPGRQSIARNHRKQWQPNWIIGARP
jgi:hypothetical protein